MAPAGAAHDHWFEVDRAIRSRRESKLLREKRHVILAALPHGRKVGARQNPVIREVLQSRNVIPIWTRRARRGGGPFRLWLHELYSSQVRQNRLQNHQLLDFKELELSCIRQKEF